MHAYMHVQVTVTAITVYPGGPRQTDRQTVLNQHHNVLTVTVTVTVSVTVCVCVVHVLGRSVVH